MHKKQKTTVLLCLSALFVGYILGQAFPIALQKTAAIPLESRTDREAFVEEKAKINVNTADRDLLLSVSGMTEELAENIMQFREENGEIPSLDFLLPLANKSVYEKVVPYLTAE